MGLHQEKMSSASLNVGILRSKKEDLDGLPDLRALNGVENEALWCLWFAKEKADIDYLSAAEISAVLSDVFEISCKEPAIRMALMRAGAKVHIRSFGRTNKFSIMKIGRESVCSSANEQVFVVDPAQPHTAICKVAELFGGFAGRVKICDPYLDDRTLGIVAMISDSCVVQFLSTPPQNAIAFSRHYGGYRAQHRNIEIRILPAGQLHDRYVLVGQDMWLIGHSLNRIGTKQTFVVKLGGGVKQEVEKWFDLAWSSAQILR